MLTLSITAWRSTGSTVFMPWFLSLLARAYAGLSQFDDAWRCIGEAMTAVETTKEKWCEAEVHRVAGEIALLSQEPDAAKAETYFERALGVARKQQAKSWELRAAMDACGCPHQGHSTTIIAHTSRAPASRATPSQVSEQCARVGLSRVDRACGVGAPLSCALRPRPWHGQSPEPTPRRTHRQHASVAGQLLTAADLKAKRL
jgi:predicted ATPase